MTKRLRGFEVIEKYKDSGINLPKRNTKNAAGYDFQASEDVVIPSVIKEFAKQIGKKLNPFSLSNKNPEDEKELASKMKPVLVPTGIKSYMDDNEYLQLANRSSNPLKKFIMLANGIGVIDADYYNNEGNEGHIMFQFVNFGLTDVTLKKGENIGQGTFLPFLKADNDISGDERKGGFGSTDA